MCPLTSVTDCAVLQKQLSNAEKREICVCPCILCVYFGVVVSCRKLGSQLINCPPFKSLVCICFERKGGKECNCIALGMSTSQVLDYSMKQLWMHDELHVDVLLLVYACVQSVADIFHPDHILQVVTVLPQHTDQSTQILRPVIISCHKAVLYCTVILWHSSELGKSSILSISVVGKKIFGKLNRFYFASSIWRWLQNCHMLNLITEPLSITRKHVFVVGKLYPTD